MRPRNITSRNHNRTRQLVPRFASFYQTSGAQKKSATCIQTDILTQWFSNVRDFCTQPPHPPSPQATSGTVWRRFWLSHLGDATGVRFQSLAPSSLSFPSPLSQEEQGREPWRGLTSALQGDWRTAERQSASQPLYLRHRSPLSILEFPGVAQ